MSQRTIAITGASGKTGFRIAEELMAYGDCPRLLLRSESVIPETLSKAEQVRISLQDPSALDAALKGVDALVIATGARPSIDLLGPMRVDAWGVRSQVESCLRVGVSRVILVSSLCAGAVASPPELVWSDSCLETNWEQALENSGLDWTVIRPGGLSEREQSLEEEGVYWTGPNQQEKDSIPRRLVARCCVEALNTPASIGKILEVTSSASRPLIALPEALLSIDS